VLALRKRLWAFLPEQQRTQAKNARTLEQLQGRAEELERTEHARQVEAARKKHLTEMTALAKREDQAWQEVNHLLEHGRKIASVYDDATARLEKLKQLSEFQHAERTFQGRVQALAEKYANRPALIRRWEQQGWL
jgi:hypothetical protein